MTDKPQTVRPLLVSDEERLFDLLLLAHRENAPYTINENKVRHVIAAAARDKDVIVGVVDSPDGLSLVGSIGAGFSQWWYTDDWHIEECWNFVHSDHRKSSYATDLIDYMKWISENMDMPLHMGILTSTRMEAKTRMYRRKMPQVGAAFAYNMKVAHGPIAGDIANG